MLHHAWWPLVHHIPFWPTSSIHLKIFRFLLLLLFQKVRQYFTFTNESYKSLYLDLFGLDLRQHMAHSNTNVPIRQHYHLEINRLLFKMYAPCWGLCSTPSFGQRFLTRHPGIQQKKNTAPFFHVHVLELFCIFRSCLILPLSASGSFTKRR